MAKLVSLSTVTMTITNPSYGQVVIGGTGQMVGNISMERGNSAFSVSGTPDGGYYASFTRNKAGSFNVSISQSGSLVKRLVDFIVWCENNPELAESEISIVDTLGNIEGTGKGVFPDKIPNNSIGESAGTREFTFNAGIVDFGEGDKNA